MNSLSVSSAVERFLANVRELVSPASWRLYRLYLGRLAARFGNVLLVDLSPADVRAWGKKFHPIQAAKRLTRWAATEALLIPADPLSNLRYPRVGRRLRTLSPEESVRMLRASQGAFRRFVLALGESIARPAELRALTWANIREAGLKPFQLDSLQRGHAFGVLDAFKGRDKRQDGIGLRVIPIGPRLGRLLARLWAKGPELHARVFLNERGRPWTVNAVRCAFRRLRDRVGLGPDWRGERVVAYTLRHTSATAAIVAGVEVGALAGAMGHADVRTTMKYVHLAPAFLAQVVEKMNHVRRTTRRAWK